MTYRLTVEEAVDGELYIKLPDSLLEEMGWEEGMDLLWVVDEDGTIVLKENK